MEFSLPLTRDMVLVLGLVLFVIVMFIVEKVRVDVTAVLVLVILGLTELVPIEHLFDGFAGNAVISIIAVMILGAGLDRTGVLGRTASWILKLSQGNEHRLIGLMCLFAGLISAVMQNPAVAALFLPVAARLSSRTGIPLSRLLLPMACCVILGGTVTMVGSSPLILLNDLIGTANRNLPPGASTLPTLRMFAVAPVGLVLLGAGLAYFLLVGARWLPAREDKPGATPSRTESYFAQTYGIDGDVVELTVTAESPLVGMRIGEAEGHLDAPVILAMKTQNEARLAPPADELIWVGSVLGVLGHRDRVQEYAQQNDLRLLPRLRNFADLFNPSRAGISEAVIPPTSRFVGQKVGDLRLRKRYGISVLAVSRGTDVFREDVREVQLRPGDLLVMHSPWRDLVQAADSRDFVLVTDVPKEEQRPHKVWHALFFFALALGLALATDVKLPVALLTGAVGMLLFGVLSMDEAYAAVSWKTVFLMAGLIPLGWAMDTTGAAAWVAQELLNRIGAVPPWALQAILAVLTSLFALVITNVGATVVMVPMAINLALVSGGNPMAFAVVVALAASSNFISASNPVLSIVAGPAGYSARDLLRVGGPLTVLFLVLVLVMVNVVF
jgi:di/tricarboxylate transporter